MNFLFSFVVYLLRQFHIVFDQYSVGVPRISLLGILPFDDDITAKNANRLQNLNSSIASTNFHMNWIQI